MRGLLVSLIIIAISTGLLVKAHMGHHHGHGHDHDHDHDHDHGHGHGRLDMFGEFSTMFGHYDYRTQAIVGTLLVQSVPVVLMS